MQAFVSVFSLLLLLPSMKTTLAIWIRWYRMHSTRMLSLSSDRWVGRVRGWMYACLSTHARTHADVSSIRRAVLAKDVRARHVPIRVEDGFQVLQHGVYSLLREETPTFSVGRKRRGTKRQGRWRENVCDLRDGDGGRETTRWVCERERNGKREGLEPRRNEVGCEGMGKRTEGLHVLGSVEKIEVEMVIPCRGKSPRTTNKTMEREMVGERANVRFCENARERERLQQVDQDIHGATKTHVWIDRPVHRDFPSKIHRDVSGECPPR